MDHSQHSIEEGPLSDLSSENQIEDAEDTGLPLQYLLGVQDLEQEQFESRFYRLQVEDTTAFSSLESSNPEAVHQDSSSIRLELSLNDPPRPGGIIFSPCGTQALVYPVQHSPNVTEFKRPATVGQSKEDVIAKPILDTSIKSTPDDLGGRKVTSGLQLQVRMEDFKNSLDFATFSQIIPASVPSSADPSPRIFKMGSNIRERYLLQEPENFCTSFSVSDHDVTGEAESLNGTPSPLITARALAERANSPSVASVTSGYSAASSAPGGTARRHLEWDSGADLGYIGERLVAQKDVAASLSTLEKLAIGNYSNFFRSEPEGKPSSSGQPPYPRLPGPDREEEMRKMRLESYANSLLRQSHHQQAKAMQSSAAAMLRNTPSKSAASANPTAIDDQLRSKSKPSQSISPTRRRRSVNRTLIFPDLANRPGDKDRIRSPLRSASLTDLTSLTNRRGSDWFTKRPPSTQNRSEPSSSSSTATVVQMPPITEPLEKTILRAFSSMDPRSLPPSLQGLLTQDLHQLQNLAEIQIDGGFQWQIPGRASLNSLGSHYSQSRSFETVIRAPESDSLDTEEELQLLRESTNQSKNTSKGSDIYFGPKSAWTALVTSKESSRAKSVPKETIPQTKENVLTNIWLHKRSKEKELVRNETERTHGQALTTSNEDTDCGTKKSHGTQTQQRDFSGRSGRRSVGTYTGRWSNRTQARNLDRGSSMPATTSEDDLQHHEVEVSGARPRRRPNFPTNSSTLESSGHIDRAKSFEYIPGESFPLQENSSSYEYLPGHLVDDRPATVVSLNSTNQKVPRKDPYTSEFFTTEESISSRSSTNDQYRCNLSQTEDNLDAKDLKDRPHQPTDAHSKNTKVFYKRLQKYIKYLSVPSQTPEDCRLKQEIASKVLSLYQAEEINLAQLNKPLKNDVSSKESDSETHANPNLDTVDKGKHFRKKSKSMRQPAINEAAQDPLPGVSNNLLAIQPDSYPDDIEVQKMRIEQMRKLRRELRTLEKLERLRLNKAVGGPTTVDEHILRQFNDNSFDSVSTTLTETSVTARLNTEGLSASETWTRSGPQTTRSTQKKASPCGHVKENSHKRSTSRLSGKQSPKRLPGATGKIIKKLSEGKANGLTEFGQTFPSPRESKEVKGSENNPLQSKTEMPVTEESVKNERRIFTIKRNPIAYYLPLSNQSPIMIGKRILREKSREQPLGKENRSILANYMSALNFEPKPINRKPHSFKEEASFKEIAQRISLQDALAQSRPDLLKKFQERSRKLREIKLMRLEYEAEMRNWISANETLAEADRTPKPLPPIFERKIPHIFNYKDMVFETRRKYQLLPEVRRQQLESRRRSAYRTNRIMANIFKRKLKTKALTGHVSHTHSSRVV